MTGSRPGPWTLGNKYKWVNLIAIVWVALCVIIFCLPFTPAAVPFSSTFSWSAFNYAPLVTIVVIAAGHDLVLRLGQEHVQGPDPHDRPRSARAPAPPRGRQAWRRQAAGGLIRCRPPPRRGPADETGGKVCVITGAAGGIGAATRPSCSSARAPGSSASTCSSTTSASCRCRRTSPTRRASPALYRAIRERTRARSTCCSTTPASRRPRTHRCSRPSSRLGARPG